MEDQKRSRKYLSIASLILLSLTALVKPLDLVPSDVRLSVNGAMNYTVGDFTVGAYQKHLVMNVDKKLDRLSSELKKVYSGSSYYYTTDYFTFHFIEENEKAQFGNFYSVDCRYTYCFIGTDSAVSHIQTLEEHNANKGYSSIKKTYSIPSSGKIYITKIPAKIDLFKDMFLAVAKAESGVFLFSSLSTAYQMKNFKPEETDKEALPISLLEYYFTDYLIVTYNHKFMEVFELTSMTKRTAKYDGGGLLTYLELEKSLIISVYNEGVYKGKILTLESGEVKTTINFDNVDKVVGLVSYRFSPFYVTLNVKTSQASVTVYQYEEGTGVKQIYKHFASAFYESNYSPYLLRRNLLLKNEFIDNFFFPRDERENTRAPVATLLTYEMRFVKKTGWINPICETSRYSLSTDCTQCKSTAKKVGYLCIPKTKEELSSSQDPNEGKSLNEIENEKKNEETQETNGDGSKVNENGEKVQDETEVKGTIEEGSNSSVVLVVVGVILIVVIVIIILGVACKPKSVRKSSKPDKNFVTQKSSTKVMGLTQIPGKNSQKVFDEGTDSQKKGKKMIEIPKTETKIQAKPKTIEVNKIQVNENPVGEKITQNQNQSQVMENQPQNFIQPQTQQFNRVLNPPRNIYNQNQNFMNIGNPQGHNIYPQNPQYPGNNEFFNPFPYAQPFEPIQPAGITPYNPAPRLNMYNQQMPFNGQMNTHNRF